MHYLHQDVSRLLAAVPALALGNRRRALDFVSHAADEAVALEHLLLQYPAVRYEPLDFHYVCLQSLAVADEPLIADLCTDHAWVGVVWASVLCLLDPKQGYRVPLSAALSRVPHNEWLVRLALDLLDEQDPAECPRQYAEFRRLARLLAKAPRARVRLHGAPTLEENEAARVRNAEVRAAYSTGGAVAALGVMRLGREGNR